MHVRFFGQFLLRNRVLNREQLAACVRLQSRKNRSLQEIAVESGVLNRAQTGELLRVGAYSAERFSERAIALGFADADGLAQLQATLDAEHLHIGAAAVELGYANQAEIDRHLEAFELALTDDRHETLTIDPDLPGSTMLATVLELTEQMMIKTAKLPVHRGGRGDEPCFEDDGVSAAIEISGALAGVFQLTVPKQVAYVITRQFIGEAHTIDDAFAVEGVQEFCNVLFGVICTRMESYGIPIDSSPPLAESIDETSAWSLECPLYVPGGALRMRLRLVEQDSGAHDMATTTAA